MKATAVKSKIASRPRVGPMIGLLALDADATIEDEWRDLFSSQEVGFYTGRVSCDTEITPNTLAAVEEPLGDAVAALLPGTKLDSIAFACTSASLFLGEETVTRIVGSVRPGTPVTTPLTAAKASLARLQAERIGLLTPYVDAINEPLAAHLSAAGHQVVSMASFFVGNDVDVVRITARSISEAVRVLMKVPVDALLIACTAVRASALVPGLEAELGVPVTTSNHALAWHSLELAGGDANLSQRGRLFDLKR